MAKENKQGFWQPVKEFFSKKSLLFDNWGSGGLRNRTEILNSNAWRGEQSNGMFFFGAFANKDVDLYVNGDNGKAWYWNAYTNCPTVASIINRKAEAFINGITTISTATGENQGKENFGPVATKIRKLLIQPNPLQSWSQFEAQYKVYYQVYGFCLILPIKAVGFNKPEDTKYFWIIPPGIIEIKESKKIWYNDNGRTLIEGITLRYGTEETQLKWDELIILKDFNPSASSLVLPASRLLSYKRAIDAVIKGYRAISNGFDNTPLGILGNDTKDSNSFIPLLPEELIELRNTVNHAGLGDGQKSIIVSNANMTWQPMNYPLASLQIPENIKIANTAICDGLGYPYDLLSRQEGSTYANRQEAGKELYQNFIIPESKSVYEQWNAYFKTSELNLIIENDYSHLPILQQDELSKATARKVRNEALSIEFKNDLITVNRWLELNGEDTRLGGNVYYSQWVKDNPQVITQNNSQQQNLSNATQ